MSQVINFLNGKKTFIGAAVVFIAGGLHAIGYIDDAAFQSLAALGAAIAVYGLRVALNRKK